MADREAWMVGMVEVVRAAVEQAAVARDLVGKGSVVGQEVRVMMEEIAMGVATG